MVLETIAVFHSPLTSKFGTPRQSGVVSELLGKIVLESPYRSADAIRGMEGFDYLWLIWGFSANRKQADSLTVRPPRLGGNDRVGVFASRSPYRPNAMGLSSVKLHHIDYDCDDAPVIYVAGADLIEGTPIFDIKPYVAYTDAHPQAKSGFTDTTEWQPLEVVFSREAQQLLNAKEYQVLKAQQPIISQLLMQDPRPHYHADATRVYGMEYAGFDIRFTVAERVLTVVDIKKK